MHHEPTLNFLYIQVQFFKSCNSFTIILHLILTYLFIQTEINYFVVADNELPAETSVRGCFTQTSTSLERFIRMNQHSPQMNVS